MERDKYRAMFVQEAHEHIQNLNDALLRLEQQPEATPHLDNLFRSAHTLKGTAATIGYEQIARLSKAIEEILDKLRRQEIKLSSNLTSSLFKCFDVLEEMLEHEDKKINVDMYVEQLQNALASRGEHREAVAEDIFERGRTRLPTIRVDMETLDGLVNLVGELVLAKMRLEQTLSDNISDGTRQVLTVLNRLISEIQDATMGIRLVPIEQVFNRFPRMVRDLSKSQGKEVKLEMEGLEIELDRMILTAITDPLLHILRNAVDHGIEPTSERVKNSKPKSGTIRIKASRVSDLAEILVEDDGAGIRLEEIRRIAVEKGAATTPEVQNMADDDVISLLGTPGLTTVRNATDISGRGVGLNVVRNQVEGIGGQVRFETKKGRGTRVILTIPLSLAIVGGLLVRVAGERYVIPVSNVTSILRVEAKEIKTIQGRQLITIQGRLVPLTTVNSLLGGRDSVSCEEVTVVVIHIGDRVHGLIVDSVEHKQEVVIKRLESSTPIFTNATILPDGSVALILDPTLLI